MSRPDGADGIEIAGPRAEGEAIESVEDALVALQLVGLIGSTGPGVNAGLIGTRRRRLSEDRGGWSQETEAQERGYRTLEELH